MTGETHLVLLHGSNGCADAMEPLAAPLRAYARVHVMNLPGHGGRPIPPRLSVSGNTEDVLGVLDRQGIERAFIVGYSTGGLMALHFARHHPQRVLGVAAVATRIHLDQNVIDHWCHILHPDRLTRPGNPRAGQLLLDHGPEWLKVARANTDFFRDMLAYPPLNDADLELIGCPALIVNANRDQLVPWSETEAVGKALRRSKLVMFYGLGHPLSSVPVNQVAEAIGQWMAEVAPA